MYVYEYSTSTCYLLMVPNYARQTAGITAHFSLFHSLSLSLPLYSMHPSGLASDLQYNNTILLSNRERETALEVRVKTTLIYR